MPEQTLADKMLARAQNARQEAEHKVLDADIQLQKAQSIYHALQKICFELEGEILKEEKAAQSAKEPNQ